MLGDGGPCLQLPCKLTVLALPNNLGWNSQAKQFEHGELGSRVEFMKLGQLAGSLCELFPLAMILYVQ